MRSEDISLMRLNNQLVTGQKRGTAKEVVARMGAIQAQDYIMARWAVGIRHHGSTENMIESALDRGEILRTHVMRPTWHLVTAEDIRWMISLTAPRIKSSLKSRHNALEITDSVLKKTYTLINNALKGGNHLTRQELNQVFLKAGIKTDDNRASHLLLYAELECHICSGASRKGKPTYALMDERVPVTPGISRTDALAKLALRYFSSHGPAALQDFIWWSGLSTTDARNALEMIKPVLKNYTMDGTEFWMEGSSIHSERVDLQVYLLPAYDEFLISYRDRSAALSTKYDSRTISNNGIFRPVILIKGRVAGIWKRELKNNKIVLETNMFQNHSNKIQYGLEKAIGDYARFTGVVTEAVFKSNRPAYYIS